MAIVLNSFDVCVQGFERLHMNSEFILAVPVNNTMTRQDVLDALLADVQACERPIDFDYEGARVMLNEAFATNLDSPFDATLETSHDDGTGFGCYLFMYCEQV